MIKRLSGAFLRAALLFMAAMTPSLATSAGGDDMTMIVGLLAFFAAVLVFAEYAAASPALIEFRFAPPYNRIRYGAFALTLLVVSLAAVARSDPSTLARFVAALGGAVGTAIDFPYSPMRLLVLTLPPDAPAEQIALLRALGGVAGVTALAALIWFAAAMRIQRWPLGRGPFNLCVNLPTFDQTGGDVVSRLRAEAWVNVALGALAPFLTPAFVKCASLWAASAGAVNLVALIWLASVWAMAPALLLMRAMATARIAAVIERKRQSVRLTREAAAG